MNRDSAMESWQRLLMICVVLLVTCQVGVSRAAPPTNRSPPRVEDDRQESTESIDAVKRKLYLTTIGLAHREWQSGQVAHAKELLSATAEEYRGWEYKYLERLFAQELRIIEVMPIGRNRWIRHVEFSPDGKWLAACSNDLRTRLWDVASGKKRWDYHIETRSVSFSPDSQSLVTGLSGGVTISNVKDARSIKRFSAGSSIYGSGLRAEFNQDGSRVASTDSQRGVRMWDVKSGKQLFYLENEGRTFRFTPDGKQLAIINNRVDWKKRIARVTVSLFDATTGRKIDRPTIDASPIRSRHAAICFSPDGKQLAIAGLETPGQACYIVVDVKTGLRKYVARGHTGGINDIRYSPDGQLLATAGQDGLVKIWDAASGRQLHTLRGHTGAVSSISFSPDGMTLASGSHDGTIRLWDMTASPSGFSFKSRAMTWQSHWFGRIERLSSFGRRLLVVQSRYHRDVKAHRANLTLTDSLTGRNLLHWSDDRVNAIGDAVYSHAGKCVAACLVQHEARKAVKSQFVIWDSDSGKPRLRIAGPPQSEARLAFSRDGEMFAAMHVTKGPDEPDPELKMQIWNARDGKLLHETKLNMKQGATVLRPQFSSDGSQLVAGVLYQSVADRRKLTIFRYDVKSRSRLDLVEIELPDVRVTRLAFSPNHERLALAMQLRGIPANRGRIDIWNIAGARRERSIEAPMYLIGDVTFSPDGKSIATLASQQNGPSEIAIWDVTTGLRVLLLEGPFGEAAELAFDEDGHRLTVVSLDNKVRVIQLDPASEALRLDRAAVTLLQRLTGEGIKRISRAEVAKLVPQQPAVGPRIRRRALEILASEPTK